MRHLIPAVSAAVLAAALSLTPAVAVADVQIAATSPDLAAISKEIGGNRVDVVSLSLPTQDPHFVDAKPSLIIKVHNADMLIEVGLDLEIGWLPALQTQARNRKITVGGSGFVDCSTAVHVLDMNGRADRAQGDVHPAGNPHYLYDPRAAASCARLIAGKLSAIDPDHAAGYHKNLRRFLGTLSSARARWEKKMAPYRGKPILSYHKSMTYLVNWLGLDEIGTLEPKPGIPPTAQHVLEIIKLARKVGAKVVFQESYYPDKAGHLVADKIGGSVVVVSGGADVARGESYIAHMNELVDDLARAFR